MAPIVEDLLQSPHLLEADIRGLRTSQTDLTEYAKLSNFEQLDTLGMLFVLFWL